jgi:hypothetical protein
VVGDAGADGVVPDCGAAPDAPLGGVAGGVAPEDPLSDPDVSGAGGVADDGGDSGADGEAGGVVSCEDEEDDPSFWPQPAISAIAKMLNGNR